MRSVFRLSVLTTAFLMLVVFQNCAKHQGLELAEVQDEPRSPSGDEKPTPNKISNWVAARLLVDDQEISLADLPRVKFSIGKQIQDAGRVCAGGCPAQYHTSGVGHCAAFEGTYSQGFSETLGKVIYDFALKAESGQCERVGVQPDQATSVIIEALHESRDIRFTQAEMEVRFEDVLVIFKEDPNMRPQELSSTEAH